MPVFVKSWTHQKATDAHALYVTVNLSIVPVGVVFAKGAMDKYGDFFKALCEVYGSSDHGLLSSDKLLKLAQMMHEIELAEAEPEKVNYAYPFNAYKIVQEQNGMIKKVPI
jgi:hypothetical protein